MSVDTYADFVQALPASKNASNPWWCRAVLRPISMPIAWWLYRAGIRGNTVSAAGLLLCVLAACLLAYPSYAGGLVAALLFNGVALIDCVDGNIARARKETGPRGDWIDAMIGYTTYLLLPLALGFRVSFEGGEPYAMLPVALGGLAAGFNSYTRLTHQKYEAAHLKAGIVQEPGSAQTRAARLMDAIAKPTGLVGFMMPALLLVVALGAEMYYLWFYAALYLAAAVVTATVRVTRVVRG